MDGVLILLVYAGIGIATVTLGVLLYSRAVASRKRYRCPKCREVVTVELMDATRCNVCGSRLRDPRHDYEDEGDYGTAS